MFRQKSGAFLVIPNLFLLLSQALPKPEGRVFDEGYLAADQQLWIKYDSSHPDRFQGVWANFKDQKKIKGFRQGKNFFFLSETGWWKAELQSSSASCEPALNLQNLTSQEKPIQFKANFCERKEKKNVFF